MRKIFCFNLNKKIIFFSLFLLTCFGLSLGFIISFNHANALATSANVAGVRVKTIVIDAGHGGIDGGMVGKISKVPESSINLAIAKELQILFEKAKYNVVMTRTTSSGLYGDATKNLKKVDMKARGEIIKSSNASLMLSIHQNSYRKASARGAQVFFQKDETESERFAISIQSMLNKNLPASSRVPMVGDYFVLNVDKKTPSVLVECGFLSNPTDEANLLKIEYRKLIARSIFDGCRGLL